MATQTLLERPTVKVVFRHNDLRVFLETLGAYWTNYAAHIRSIDMRDPNPVRTVDSPNVCVMDVVPEPNVPLSLIPQEKFIGAPIKSSGYLPVTQLSDRSVVELPNGSVVEWLNTINKPDTAPKPNVVVKKVGRNPDGSYTDAIVADSDVDNETFAQYIAKFSGRYDIKDVKIFVNGTNEARITYQMGSNPSLGSRNMVYPYRDFTFD